MEHAFPAPKFHIFDIRQQDKNERSIYIFNPAKYMFTVNNSYGVFHQWFDRNGSGSLSNHVMVECALIRARG